MKVTLYQADGTVAALRARNVAAFLRMRLMRPDQVLELAIAGSPRSPRDVARGLRRAIGRARDCRATVAVDEAAGVVRLEAVRFGKAAAHV
jgi:hypothetical protein